MNNWMICRSGATLSYDPEPQTRSSYSVWSPDDDDRTSRPAPRTPPAKSSGTVLLMVDEPPSLDPIVPVVRATRRTEWFGGRVAELPKRAPHISPLLLELTAEDE